MGLCTRAARPLIRVHTNWASGVCWSCLSCVHSPGAEGVGLQRTRLLWRILSTASECLYFLFFFLGNSSYSFLLDQKAPLIQTSTWPLTQPSLALSQESCSSPCTWAGASVALVPALVPGTLLSLSTLLTVRSFNVLYLWSPIFIYAGIVLAVRSVPQIT